MYFHWVTAHIPKYLMRSCQHKFVMEALILFHTVFIISGTLVYILLCGNVCNPTFLDEM
jgi:hypothetical protein